VSLCLLLLVTLVYGCKAPSSSPAGEKGDDRAIVARIQSVISEDPALSGHVIRVFAQEGKVTLSGPVPDREAKSRLLARAKDVKGVKSVSDNLELPTPP
jgi:hyperosmotically inducible protein